MRTFVPLRSLYDHTTSHWSPLPPSCVTVWTTAVTTLMNAAVDRWTAAAPELTPVDEGEDFVQVGLHLTLRKIAI